MRQVQSYELARLAQEPMKHGERFPAQPDVLVSIPQPLIQDVKTERLEYKVA
jgi:hypothetical protein